MSLADGRAWRARRQASPGTLVALASGASLALLALAVSRGMLATPDHGLLTHFATLRGPMLDEFFKAVTWLGSGYVLAPATILLLLSLSVRRQWKAAWRMGITYFGASLTTWMLKQAFTRERPGLHAVLEDIPRLDWSFPSGHTSHAAAFALGLWLLLRECRARWITPVTYALLGVVLLVGASRLHLQVHWPSDVLAGMLVATLWAGLATTHARSGMRTGVAA